MYGPDAPTYFVADFLCPNDLSVTPGFDQICRVGTISESRCIRNGFHDSQKAIASEGRGSRSTDCGLAVSVCRSYGR